MADWDAASTKGLAVLIGAGPGGEGLLSREGERWLRRCDCVIYDRLIDANLLNLAPPEAEKIDAGKSPSCHPLPQEDLNALLVSKVREGKIVARLKGGDPLLFGRGGEEIDALCEAGLPFRIVPGITAALAASAYTGVALTDRRSASTVALVTGHEDPDKKGISRVNYAALAGIDTVVFYMGVARLEALCRNLLRAGKAPDTPALVVENAAAPRQRTLCATLATLPDRAREASLQAPAIVIVGRVAESAARRGWFERLPLKGQCVLVTRPAGHAAELCRALAERGADVIEAPAIEIAPPADEATLDAALERIAEFDWLVLTSPNGVEAVRKRLAARGRDARALAGVKLAALGQATAAALQAGGLRADLVPGEFTTAALGQALVAQGLAGRRVLLARSDIAPPDLAETCRQAGAQVAEVIAYRTRCPAGLPRAAEEALRKGCVDWIVFTSASTVKNFLAMVEEADRLRSCRLAAIGPVTAQALRRAGLEPVVVATPHTQDALVEAITQPQTAKRSDFAQ